MAASTRDRILPGSPLSLTTDKQDYAPGSTALFTLTDAEVGATFEFQVLHIEGTGADGVYGTTDDLLDEGPDLLFDTEDDGYGEAGNTDDHDPFTVTDGVRYTIDAGSDGIDGTADDVYGGDLDGLANGTIITSWYVNPDDSINERFLLAAAEVDVGDDGLVGTSDDSYTGRGATTTFTDAAGDFSLDFIAAEPTSYNHLTGGGAYDDSSKNFDTVEQLEGGDFACGDIVTFFLKIDVDDTVSAFDDGPQTLEFDFSFLADTTGQSGIAFGDVTFVGINYGPIEDLIAGENTIDDGIIDDGGSTATLIPEGLDGPIFIAGSEYLATVQVDDLERNESVVLRIDAQLYCEPGSNPTGNLQAALTDARLIAIKDDTPVDPPEAVPGGEQTIPLKQVGNVGSPALAIVKSVDADGDGVFNDTETVQASGATTTVDYEYVISNPGDAGLFDVVVLDDAGTPGDISDDFTVTGFTGLTDLDNDGLLDDLAAGTVATAIVSVTYDSPSFSDPDTVVTNIATATGEFAPFFGSGQLTATDDATVTITPPPTPDLSVEIVKTTYSNGDLADASDGVKILAQSVSDPTFTGSDVTWRYAVTNTGDDAPGTALSVSDDVEGDISPLDFNGDGVVDGDDGDGVFENGETWLFEASGSAQVGFYGNLGTASVDFGGAVATDTDPSSYTGLTAEVTLDKSGSLDVGSDGVATAGDIITYTLTINNTGTSILSGLVINDPLPGITLVDITDSAGDGDLVLADGNTETATLTYAITQADIDAGIVNNTATVSGSFTDDFGNSATPEDAASAAVPVPQNPSILLDKRVVGVDAAGDGVLNNAGEIIEYEVEVFNTGNLTLTNVTVVDPLTGADLNVGDIAVGESATVTGLTYAMSQADLDDNGGGDGDIDNTATADSDQTGPDDDSEAVPLALEPSIDLVKTGVFNDDSNVKRYEGDGVAQVGETLTYTFGIKNDGNVVLDTVILNDLVLGITNVEIMPDGDLGDLTWLGGDDDGDGLLDVGEIWSVQTDYAITRADLDAEGKYNRADVTAEDPRDVQVTDWDDEFVFFTDNQRSIEQDVSSVGYLCDGEGPDTFSGSVKVTDQSDDGAGQQLDLIINDFDLFVEDKGANGKGGFDLREDILLTKVWVEGLSDDPNNTIGLFDEGIDTLLVDENGDLSDGWQGIVLVDEEDNPDGSVPGDLAQVLVEGDEIIFGFEFTVTSEEPDYHYRPLGDPFRVTTQFDVLGRDPDRDFEDTESFPLDSLGLYQCDHFELA